jgi:hypothetical protein
MFFLNKNIKFTDFFFKFIFFKNKTQTKKKLIIQNKKIIDRHNKIFFSKKLKNKNKIFIKKYFLNNYLKTQNKNSNKDLFFKKILNRGFYSKLYFTTLFCIYTGVSIN